MKRLLALACWLPALAWGQTNLKFQEGLVGQVPPGWFVLDPVENAGYAATWQRDGCRGGAGCALLEAPAAPPPESFGVLMQSFDAQPFRGKKVRLRAWIRVERKALADHAQMLLHVGRPDLQQGFVDNMADRPISVEDWRRYEIQGEVAPDAETIRIGVTLYGLGRVWVSDVEFGPAEEETSGPAVDAARDAIGRQYARLDAAFARGDASGIGTVLMPDAQMGVGTIREPLLPAIEEEIAKGAKLTARTAVTTVRLDGDEAIALVRREAADPLGDGKRSVVTTHRDTWIQTDNGWRWRESIEVSYHWVMPPTGADAARPVVAELKARAVAGTDNLAAFGAAVGDARVVALGEAARGTREFTEWKQRLADYLVKEKGFTVVSAASDAEFAAFLAADARGTDAKTRVALLTDNAHARALRQKWGRKVYAAGFAFYRGAVRAVGVEGGESRGLNAWTAPPSPEGSGDAVLSAAGLPQFFLDMDGLPGSGALARWLVEAHLFHDLGAYWVLGDPDASLQPEELSKWYDGLFFVEEVHAAN
jgi:hypothetical protein